MWGDCESVCSHNHLRTTLAYFFTYTQYLLTVNTHPHIPFTSTSQDKDTHRVTTNRNINANGFGTMLYIHQKPNTIHYPKHKISTSEACCWEHRAGTGNCLWLRCVETTTLSILANATLKRSEQKHTFSNDPIKAQISILLRIFGRLCYLHPL